MSSSSFGRKNDAILTENFAGNEPNSLAPVAGKLITDDNLIQQLKQLKLENKRHKKEDLQKLLGIEVPYDILVSMNDLYAIYPSQLNDTTFQAQNLETGEWLKISHIHKVHSTAEMFSSLTLSNGSPLTVLRRIESRRRKMLSPMQFAAAQMQLKQSPTPPPFDLEDKQTITATPTTSRLSNSDNSAGVVNSTDSSPTSFLPKILASSTASSPTLPKIIKKVVSSPNLSAQMSKSLPFLFSSFSLNPSSTDTPWVGSRKASTEVIGISPTDLPPTLIKLPSITQK